MIDQRLITFLTLARVRSYTKTAEILNLTQPAVSQHIKFLEEAYNVKLFKKKSREIVLTEEGTILYKYAKELDKISLSLKKELTNKNSILKSYNIGATRTIGGYVLPSILGEYKKMNENIDIILTVDNNQEIIKRLVERKIELAFIEGPFDKDKFLYEKFKDDELVLAVSAKNGFSNRKYVTIDEVLNGNLILREKGSGTRVIFENKLEELNYDTENLKPYMEIGSITAIKGLVELDLGYTIVSREAIKKELNIGSIKIVNIKSMIINREFNIIYNRDSDLEFVKDFIKFAIYFAKI